MKIRAAGLILIVMLMGAVGAQGQDGYAPVFTTRFGLYNISWSNDSSSITFQDDSLSTGIISNRNNWHEYVVATPNITSSSLWPQPYFLPQAMPLGRFEAPDASPGSFTFLSPNGRFVAYLSPAPEGSGQCQFLAVADTEQYTGYLISNARICTRSIFDTSFQIHWSDDSLAFTVLDLNNNPQALYITNYADSVDQVTAASIYDAVMTDENIYYYEPFDLNTDGSIILMFIRLSVDGIGFHRLILWSPNTPDNIVTIAEGSLDSSFAGGAFDSTNQSVWYITAEGLFEYSLVANETRLLTADVNATWVDNAYFSPDGQYVALVRREGPSRQEVSLYVEPMAQWLGEDGA